MMQSKRQAAGSPAPALSKEAQAKVIVTAYSCTPYGEPALQL